MFYTCSRTPVIIYYRTAYYESVMINILCNKPSRRPLLLNYVRWHLLRVLSPKPLNPDNIRWPCQSLSDPYQPLRHCLGASTYTWGWTSVFSLHSVLCYFFFSGLCFPWSRWSQFNRIPISHLLSQQQPKMEWDHKGTVLCSEPLVNRSWEVVQFLITWSKQTCFLPLL